MTVQLKCVDGMVAIVVGACLLHHQRQVGPAVPAQAVHQALPGRRGLAAGSSASIALPAAARAAVVDRTRAHSRRTVTAVKRAVVMAAPDGAMVGCGR